MSFKNFSMAQDHTKKPQADGQSKAASKTEQSAKASDAGASAEPAPVSKS
ncbi:hypothetical protein [Limibacillus halophilus]|uniref:Uncharacterized protein n=1 Tax=Limibacillus halophilus TaxID=1579333 RepID=A0A839SXJ6_9PROT|nr:hypothetical protein [Limibacillus halophilus]MBB3066799.1 hypothetical protein [Limibacillus halophilus]